MGVLSGMRKPHTGRVWGWLNTWMGLPKFVPLEHVMEQLSISRSQAYALVRSGDLRAIRVGGRGQWRVDLAELEAYIERAYAATDAEVDR